jgi:hypothetical protein
MQYIRLAIYSLYNVYISARLRDDTKNKVAPIWITDIF